MDELIRSFLLSYYSGDCVIRIHPPKHVEHLQFTTLLSCFLHEGNMSTAFYSYQSILYTALVIECNQSRPQPDVENSLYLEDGAVVRK